MDAVVHLEEKFTKIKVFLYQRDIISAEASPETQRPPLFCISSCSPCWHSQAAQPSWLGGTHPQDMVDRALWSPETVFLYCVSQLLPSEDQWPSFGNVRHSYSLMIWSVPSPGVWEEEVPAASLSTAWLRAWWNTGCIRQPGCVSCSDHFKWEKDKMQPYQTKKGKPTLSSEIFILTAFWKVLMADRNTTQMQHSWRVFDNSSREIKCKAAWRWLNVLNKLGMKQALC